MSSQFRTSARNAAAEAMEADFGPSPTLRIRTGARPANCAAARQGTILAQVTLTSNWLADAVDGVKVGAATPEFLAIATGTAGHFEIMQGNNCVWQGGVGLPGSGATMELAVLDLVTNLVVRVNSLSLTVGGA